MSITINNLGLDAEDGRRRVHVVMDGLMWEQDGLVRVYLPDIDKTVDIYPEKKSDE